MLADDSDRHKIIAEINAVSNKVSQDIYNKRLIQVIANVLELTSVDLGELLLPKSKNVKCND